MLPRALVILRAGDAKCVSDELKEAVLQILGPQCIRP